MVTTLTLVPWASSPSGGTSSDFGSLVWPTTTPTLSCSALLSTLSTVSPATNLTKGRSSWTMKIRALGLTGHTRGGSSAKDKELRYTVVPLYTFWTPLGQLKVSWLKEMSSFQGCPYRGVQFHCTGNNVRMCAHYIQSYHKVSFLWIQSGLSGSRNSDQFCAVYQHPLNHSPGKIWWTGGHKPAGNERGTIEIAVTVASWKRHAATRHVIEWLATLLKYRTFAVVNAHVYLDVAIFRLISLLGTFLWR